MLITRRKKINKKNFQFELFVFSVIWYVKLCFPTYVLDNKVALFTFPQIGHRISHGVVINKFANM